MSGWKDWQPGEVVFEDDFQSFVQDQTVQIYDNSSDRSSTLGTAVAEGMVSYLKDTNEIEVYDGSSWVNRKVDKSDGSVTQATAGSAVVRNITLSTAEPTSSDGSDGDVWLVYTP